MRQDDPQVVRAEHADESRLAARKAAHRLGDGPDARRLAFDATIIFSGRDLPPREGPLTIRRSPVVFVADTT